MKKSRTKFLSVFAMLFVAIFAVSCCFFAACGNKDDDDNAGDTGTQQDGGTGSGDVDATVTGVTVAPTTLSLEEGKTGSVTATVTMSDTSASYTGTYAWESDKESVATVSGTGATATVAAVAEGTANIKVTVGEKSATCAVTVSAASSGNEDTKTTEADVRVEIATDEDADYMTIGSVAYANSDSLGISSVTYAVGKVDYTVTGTASFFESQAAADAFWYGDNDEHDTHVALEGEAYVILKIKAVEGETVTYTASDGVEKTLTYDKAEADGYYYVIIRLNGVIDDVAVDASKKEYTVTDEEGNSVTHVVDLSAVKLVDVKGFTAPIAGSAAGAADGKYNENEAIEENAFFTLTANVGMEYSLGKEYGSVSGLSYTDMYGDTYAPDQGIRMSKNIIPTNGADPDGAECYETSVDATVTVTAKTDIHVCIYVALANKSFNSQRAGTIFYTIDGAKTELTAVTKRTDARTVDVELSEGQTLSIGAENTETDASKSTNGAVLWLFGAEATAVELKESVTPESGAQYTMAYAVDETKYADADDQTTNAGKHKGDFASTFDGDADESNSVTVAYTGSTATGFGESEKKLKDNDSVSYKYYVETKSTSRYFTIQVGESVGSATITVYTSQTTSGSARSLYIGSTLSSTDDGSYADCVTVGGTGNNEVGNLYTITATTTAGNTLYVYSSGESDTMHVYAIVVTYTIA